MLKRIKDFTNADAAGLCKNNYNRALKNPCRDCPAYKQIQADSTQFACIFRMRHFVSKHLNDVLDDGSISDDQLQWWQK